jgi:uncharacterized iron-regulated membrane protein
MGSFLAAGFTVWRYMSKAIVFLVAAAVAGIVVYAKREQITAWAEQKAAESEQRARIAARVQGERERLGEPLAEKLMPGLGRKP